MSYTRMNPIYLETMKLVSTKFEEDYHFHDGIHYVANFATGFGISIIKHSSSYGHEDDLWEIAVLKDGKLFYRTPVADDVVGWLNDEQVLSYFIRIAKLTENDIIEEDKEDDED